MKPWKGIYTPKTRKILRQVGARKRRKYRRIRAKAR